MEIQVDSREKRHAIQKILAEFDKQGVKHFTSKLPIGDYMSLDNARLVVDRKKDLLEVCQNVIQDHKRFKAEIERAIELNVKLIILIEHGGSIKRLEDVIWWKNPRSEKRINVNGVWKTVQVTYQRHVKRKDGVEYDIECHPTTGLELYKKLVTIQKKYDVSFQFCDKRQTGKKIIEILKG